MIRATTTCFLLLVAMFLLVASANPGLELIHAQKSIGRVEDGQQITIFTGAVHFRQDTLDMFCDEAIFFENRDQLQFSGNVLIRDGRRLTVRARKILYHIKTKEAECFDAVQIKTPRDSVYAERLQYNFRTDRAAAQQRLHIHNSNDWVYLWGEEGSYKPDLNYSKVQFQARLVKIDSSTQDTLKINAHRLEYWSTEDPRAVATDTVLIRQGALTAICDSAVYFTETEQLNLYGRPWAKYEDSELSGLRMQASFDSLKLRQIVAHDEAKAISLVDSLAQKFNVLRGRSIIFDVEADKPKLITALDNASSVYYLKEDETDQGANYATSDTIRVFFKEGELDSIQIRGGAEGIFYPSDYTGARIFEGERE